MDQEEPVLWFQQTLQAWKNTAWDSLAQTMQKRWCNFKELFWPYFLWKVIFNLALMIFNQNPLLILFFPSLLSFSLFASQATLKTLFVAAVLESSAKHSRTLWMWSKSDCKWVALKMLGQPLDRWEMLEAVDFPENGASPMHWNALTIHQSYQLSSCLGWELPLSIGLV